MGWVPEVWVFEFPSANFITKHSKQVRWGLLVQYLINRYQVGQAVKYWCEKDLISWDVIAFATQSTLKNHQICTTKIF